MQHGDPWWWPLVGVAKGLVLWLLLAVAWLAIMAGFYGLYVWLGPKGLAAGVMFAAAAWLHFQIKDIDEGLTGTALQNMAVRLLRYLLRPRDGT